MIARELFQGHEYIMPSSITEEAIKIIDAAPKSGPLNPIAYADALPPRAAALARILSDQKIREVAEKYRATDELAMKAQGQFKWLAWASAYCGLLAAVLGGVLLYLGSEPAHEMQRANLGLAQFVFLIISLLCAFALFVLKPYRAWRANRGDAEAMRLQVFAHVMSGRSETREGEIPLLPLQLECFRRHLFDDQRIFFARRGPEHRRTVRIWKVLGGFALLLVLGASLSQLSRLERWGLYPELLRTLIAWVPLDREGYALAGLIGGSIQGLLAALTVISPAQRNADKFGEMLSRLDAYAQADLAGARAAAAHGEGTLVSKFVQRVSADLATEAHEWLMLQEALSEMTIQQLAQPK